MYALPALVFCLLLQTPSSQYPIVKNSSRNAKTQGTQEQKQTSPSPSVPGTANAPSAPLANSESQNSEADPNKRTYSVKVLSQPEPKDTTAFLLYVLVTVIAMAVNAAILYAIVRQNKINWRQLRTNVRAARAVRASVRVARENAAFSENAVKLSRRADVLLQAATFSKSSVGNITADSHIILEFRNFGSTRAENVVFDLAIIVPDLPNVEKCTPLKDDAAANLPLIMGAGDIHPVTFKPLSLWLSSVHNLASDVLTGKWKMRFQGTVTYTDVFGDKHTTYCSGMYDWAKRSFALTDNRES